VPASAFTSDRDSSAPWWDPKNFLLTRGGLRVELGATVNATRFTLRMDHSDIYEASFWRKEQRLGGYEFQMTTHEMKPHTAVVPPEIARVGYDAVQITPVRGDEIYALRYFQLITE
jgi:hypothetical protein